MHDQESLSTLGIIPARAGSKGVPRKCIRQIGERPLIARTVSSAVASKAIQRVIVSTDDEEFASIAQECGAEVPFLRPKSLAQDHSRTTDVVIHLLKQLEGLEGYSPDVICLLQPTTPFINAQDIDASFELFDEQTEAVTSVCESETNPDWLRRETDSGWLQPILELDVPQHTPRQQMPMTYRLNGGIYWIRTAVFLKGLTFLPSFTKAYKMNAIRSVDIDTEADLRMAELIRREFGFD